MNRSGNIGAAKDYDSVFANFTDEEIEQDLIFDEDDQLVEIVEGYNEDGETIFEEDQEIFNILHQVQAENDDKPTDVMKDMENELGPDNRNDQNIKDIEDVKKEELDDSQTMDNLKKNGQSEADKELGLKKLEDEYHKDGTVKEAEDITTKVKEIPIPGDDNKAEGTDDKFGSNIDNSKMTNGEEIKPDEDVNYNSTNDASVKETVDNAAPINPATDDGTNDGEQDDTTVAENAYLKWLSESEFAGEDENKKEAESKDCTCGKADCPICGKRELAPEASPVEDKAPDGERHEESENEVVGSEGSDGDGMTPNNVDDNTLPKEDDMVPEASPEGDNGDITNDNPIEGSNCEGCKKAEGEVQLTPEPEVNKVEECGDTPILPEDVAKKEEEIAKDAPSTDDRALEEAFEKWLNETEGDPSVEDSDPDTSSTSSSDSNTKDNSDPVVPDNNSSSSAPTNEMADNFGDEKKAEGTDDNFGPAIDNSKMTNGEEIKPDEDVNYNSTNDASVKENAFNKFLEKNAMVKEAYEKFLKEEAEAAEADAPTQADIKDAASTEVQDTESELDDDLAEIIDDDSEDADINLPYDPADEELIAMAGGDED